MRTVVGDWKGKDVPQRVIDAAPVFRVSKGVVVLQLNSTASDHSGVHHVEVILSPRPQQSWLSSNYCNSWPEDQGEGRLAVTPWQDPSVGPRLGRSLQQYTMLVSMTDVI